MMLSLVALNCYAIQTPPASFGQAVTIRTMQNGTVHGVFAENAKGQVFTGTWDSRTGAYRTDYYGSTTVKSATTGATSAGTVRAKVTSQVAKKTVFANVLNNAKTYGKMGIRRAGWLGLAFSLAEMALKDKGIVWDDERGDFMKPADDETYISFVTVGNSTSVATGQFTAAKYEAFCKDKNCVLLGYTRSYQAAYNLGLEYCKSIPFKKGDGSIAYFDSIGGGHNECAYKGMVNGSRIQITRYTDLMPLTQAEFDEIVEPIADKDPNRWIEGSKPEEDGEIPGISKPIVTVLDGEVAQSPPYTDPKDGKPKQTRWEFETPPEGEGDPKVREIEIPRPDLTPNSPEAPTADPDDIPKDDDTTGDNTTTDDKEQEPKEASAPFDLCKEHPEILACQQMGQPEAGMFDEISIPHVTDDTTWKEDAFLPSDGVCPAPKVFHVWGKAFSVSYEPLCELMRKVRFIVLIAFILMSAYVCFGGLKKE